MNRVKALLFFILFITVSHVNAATIEEAFASCQAWRASASPVLIANNNLGPCVQKSGAINYVAIYNGNTGGVYNGWAYSSGCISPKTFNWSTGLCVDPNTCPTGQYKNASNQCVSEPVCAVGQYVNKTDATNHVCSPVPDCNASSPAGGNYFDMATGQCKNDPNLVICISGSSVTEKYCPPIQDCKPAGYICSNDAITVAIGQEDKAAAQAAAKQRADAAAAQAATAASQAAAAAAANAAAKTQAAANAAAAKAALDAVVANPASTPAQKSAAAQAYGDALDAQAAANAKATNSGAASGTVAGHAADAQAAAGSIPGGTPTSGHAQQAADNAESALAAALGALSDAIAGIGSTPGGTEQQPCDGCAQESTLSSVDRTLQDIKDHKGHEATINGSKCSTPPTCEGDPVQCAILQTSFASACEGEDATQEMADSALGDKTDEGDGEETSLASLDSSGLGLSGTCPAPRSYSVMSATMTVDLSPFCEIAEIFGYLLIMTASFISIRILSS